MAIAKVYDEFSDIGLGKDIPGMGPFKNYRPNLAGPGSGKVKAIIRGGQYAYSYFRRNPRFGARIAAVSGGYGVSRYYARNATKGSYRKASNSKQFSKRSFRSYRNSDTGGCCCCTKHFNKRKRR